MDIRNASTEDMDVLREIFFDIRANEFFWCDKALVKREDFEAATVGEKILVASIEQEIAGFCTVWEADSFIHHLFVAKAYRNRGVGKALLAEVVRQSQTDVTLKCVKSNTHAMKFYLANGGKIQAQTDGADGTYWLFNFNRKSKNIPIMETERLSLREMTQADFPALCSILQDAEVMYAYEGGFSTEEVQEWLDRQLLRYKRDKVGLWAVILPESGQMIGQCGLTIQVWKDHQLPEVGYLFQKAYWHHGYATEAAIACRDYAFDVLDVEAVYSIIRDTNAPSQRVAERNGMKIVDRGIKQFRGIDMPHFLYEIKRESFSSDVSLENEGVKHNARGKKRKDADG